MQVHRETLGISRVIKPATAAAAAVVPSTLSSYPPELYRPTWWDFERTSSTLRVPKLRKL